jgi:hypothetical protein
MLCLASKSFGFAPDLKKGCAHYCGDGKRKRARNAYGKR